MMENVHLVEIIVQFVKMQILALHHKKDISFTKENALNHALLELMLLVKFA